jgi:hypothetical protein
MLTGCHLIDVDINDLRTLVNYPENRFPGIIHSGWVWILRS